MAFTLRKMFNIGYFKQPETENDDKPVADESTGKKRRRSFNADAEKTQAAIADGIAAFRHFEYSVKTASEPVDYFSTQKPDTNFSLTPKERRVSKKQRLDEQDGPYANCMIENTPKKISLGLQHRGPCGESDFEFDKSADNIFQFDSKSTSDFDNSDIKSLSSDSDCEREKLCIPMCRKVSACEGGALPSSAVKISKRRSLSEDDFSDIESGRNEEQRASLLLSYQTKIERADRFLRKLLTEFRFHIEVSNVLSSKSHVTTLRGSDIGKLPKMLGEINMDSISRGVSPTGSWNIVVEREDTRAKLKLRDRLLSIKSFIEEFADTYLQTAHSDIELDVPSGNSTMAEPTKTNCEEKGKAAKTLSVPVGRKIRVNRRKYEKGMNDFPDLREILQNLFALDGERHQSIDTSVSANNVTALISDYEKSDASRCTCRCPEHGDGADSSVKSTDSGLPTKPESDTITSSIGDFALDSSQLTAYSESMEQVLSYNSFEDSGLIPSMLRKSAIERITFYVQVHSVQITTTHDDDSAEARSILFMCAACHFYTPDEQGLLKHILSQSHCEKLHFLYKTAYIKRCFVSGDEIQPSTVLNSMTMYRDENKVVCFGDSKFACSLCFENGIVGESVLIAHCYQPDHIERRDRLPELMMDGSD